MKEEIILTKEEQILYSNYYNLKEHEKTLIKSLKKNFKLTIEEIARKFNITPPDVQRILKPPPDYGNYTSEEKKRHWIAGQRRAATCKKQRDQSDLLNKPKFLLK